MKSFRDSEAQRASIPRTLCQLLLVSAYAACAVTLHAQPKKKGAGGVTDQQIVEQATLAASGSFVDVFQHGLTVQPEFLKLAERAYEQLEKRTGRTFDLVTLGKVRIYVSSATGIAHVWKGYQHPADPKGFIFLNRRVYEGALNDTLSTYVHEMAHLLTWRFHSHTLREGLATYLAQQVMPGSGSGLNPGASGPPSSVSRATDPCIRRCRRVLAEFHGSLDEFRPACSVYNHGAHISCHELIGVESPRVPRCNDGTGGLGA